MDDRADWELQVLQFHTYIARLLANPGRVRLVAAGAEDHAPTLDLDEDESVENAEQRRVDDKEIGSDDRARLGAKELAPSQSATPSGRRKSAPAEK